MSLGSLLAFLVLISAFVLWLVGQMDVREALMFGCLALAILLTAVPLPWRVSA